jgi:hypothetical protein
MEKILCERRQEARGGFGEKEACVFIIIKYIRKIKTINIPINEVLKHESEKSCKWSINRHLMRRSQ